ncbi:peptide transporter family 1-like, partial [Sitodiplosis mosellana]|uniref:peptide transporter family 1-like n=1 Tax=Sitodiplosis mosellana TaxID=263140 RepID=UPI0024442C65
GLILVAFGNGGIKPCVSSFAGDQFLLFLFGKSWYTMGPPSENILVRVVKCIV